MQAPTIHPTELMIPVKGANPTSRFSLVSWTEIRKSDLAYIRASEDEDGRRQNVEVQRLQQVAEAQAARGAALAEQEAAQAREAQALQREARQARRVVRATLAGLFAALGLAGVAAWLGYNAETERARAQRALDQVISSANARVVSLAERAREAALSQGQIANLAASVATGAASAV